MDLDFSALDNLKSKTDEMQHELGDLMRQKEELERRIKELQGTCYGAVTAGKTYLDREHFPTSRPDEWYVAYESTIMQYREKPERHIWRRLYTGRTRESAIKQIPMIIKDFQELYNKLTDQGGSTEGRR